MMFDLASLGWDATFASAYTEFATATADQRPGRVVGVERGTCTVLTALGTERASLSGAVLAAAGADPSALPRVGDWVVVRTWPDGRVSVEAVLPRRAVVAPPAGGDDVPAGQRTPASGMSDPGTTVAPHAGAT